MTTRTIIPFGLTKQDLDDAPMFSAFSSMEGSCNVFPGAQDDWWAEFEIFGEAGENHYDQPVYDKACKLGISLVGSMSMPVAIEDSYDEVEEALGQDHIKFDCTDAALCYLNAGGAVAKLPDQLDSKHYRFYVVNRQEGC